MTHDDSIFSCMTVQFLVEIVRTHTESQSNKSKKTDTLIISNQNSNYTYGQSPLTVPNSRRDYYVYMNKLCFNNLIDFIEKLYELDLYNIF